jgi:hypothetical protein
VTEYPRNNKIADSKRHGRQVVKLKESIASRGRVSKKIGREF